MTAETTISEDPASKPTDYTLKERRGIELASTPKPRCSATLSLLFRAQVVVVVLMATVIDAVHYYYMTAPVEEHIGN